MALQSDIANEPTGASLNRMLGGYRTFMESVHSLVRLLETEISRQGWKLVKLGGVYGVTRNGLGSGLANFIKADWVTTYAGISFVSEAQTSLGAYSATITPIPSEGLDLLLFQVRWLDMAPPEPVVWHVRIHVDRSRPDAAEGWQGRKWEDYQTDVFRRLERDNPLSTSQSGAIKPGRVTKNGAEIVFAGQYTEVPVTELLSPEDAQSKLIQPALASSNWRKSAPAT